MHPQPALRPAVLSADESAPRRAPAGARAGSGPKGRQTRQAILDIALPMALRCGLTGLSIGALAEAAGMSKSGVFAHFGSIDDLQIAVLAEYHRRFETEVFRPAMARPRGLPRLRALFDGWLRVIARELQAGCLYIGGASELDDRPGPVRDALVDMLGIWRQALVRAAGQARETGQLPASVDVDQLIFELEGLAMAVHHAARLLREPRAVDRARRGFERLVGPATPVPVSVSTVRSTAPRELGRASEPAPAREPARAPAA